MIVNDCNVEADNNDKSLNLKPDTTSTVFMIFKEVQTSKIMSKSDYETTFNCKVDSDDANGILITDRFGNRLWVPMNMVINHCWFVNNYPNTIQIKIKS